MEENKFGKLISELRIKKNMTQKELGEKLLVSDKTISRWENGGSLPDMEMLHAISKYFRVSLNDLVTLRVASKENNDEIVQDIIKEFTKENTKKSRIIKIISISAAIIILFLIGAFIFSNSYNKFKVYKVSITSDDIYRREGIFVDTKIKDLLYLNSIAIKDYDYKKSDTISVDLYFVEDNKEYILYSYSSLDNIRFVDYESYIKIDSLSKYFDNLYIKVTIINSKNKEKVYTGKLEFTLDFSNNKIYNKDDNSVTYKKFDLSIEEIKKILLDNGFEETSNIILYKDNKNIVIHYVTTSNKFNINFEKNKLSYRYIYNVNSNILEINVFDKNNIEIESYKYDVLNDKVIECITGSCNNYKEAMKILESNILYLFYN